MNDRRVVNSIEELATQLGVVSDWVDAWGDQQKVSQTDLLGVLSALTGSPLETERAIVAATRRIVAERPVIEPVIVAWNGRFELPHLPFKVRDATITLEDGVTINLQIVDGALAPCRPLQMGYHELSLNDGSVNAHIFSAPTKAHPAPRRASGLIAPTYSLRNADTDHGIGTVGELRQLADLCLRTDVEIVGTLPLLASFPDNPSPYAPVSRRAWNELFTDFGSIPGWSESPPHISVNQLWVDYEHAGAEIRRLLGDYAMHVSNTPRLRAQVDAFVQRSPEMHTYATFRALGDHHGRNWRAWAESTVPDPIRIRYHETMQWLMDRQLSDLSRQLRERGQFLFLDLPIGCHPDGFDIWDNPDLFAKAGLGAPPDTLFVGGQDWGLPAAIPSVARADGHLNFRKAIRHQLTVAGLLRIDHVMGIHRTWWVPHGVGANQGAYVMQATDEMFAIICIESVRARAGVVGENLGTVPPEIGRGLVEHDLLGITVIQDAIKNPEPANLIALSSHDTPAFSAWWDELDIEDMLDLGVFDGERAAAERDQRRIDIAAMEDYLGTSGPIATRDALMEWVAGTDAAIALFSLDDLLMEDRRQNVPGTDRERPNWRIRNPRTIDDLDHDDAFLSQLRGLSRHRKTDKRTGGPMDLRTHGLMD